MKGSLDHPPMVIRQSRFTAVRLLLTSCAFVAVGAWMLIAKGPSWPAYLGIAFFGLGIPLFAVQLIRPGSLTVGPDGVAWRHHWRTEHLAWWQMTDFAPFRVSAMSSHPGYFYRKSRDADFQQAAFGGGWEMSAARMCDLLNQAHARWALA